MNQVWKRRCASMISTSESVLGKEGPAPAGTYYAVGLVRMGLRVWFDGDSARVVVTAP